MLTTPGRVIFNEEVGRSLARALGDGFELSDQPYINRTLGKKEMNDFITDLVDRYGALALATVLDTIKELGFHHATQAGITVSKNDIVIPESKEKILEDYEGRVQGIEDHYHRGLITEEERKERIVETWTEATDTVAEAMEETLYELNPIYMMANSGARGSFKQIRQLAGMRGLMANPKGDIIERPIKANFMEGLSVLEYFISTHGARKGLADTALRTADSGYLTRRLVDVSQDVIVRDVDCGTDEFIELPFLTADGVNRSLPGRVVAEDLHKPLKDGKPGKTVLAEKDELLTNAVLLRIEGDLEPEQAEGHHRSRSHGAQVQERVRCLPAVLRHVPRHGQPVRDRRRGRHRRRAVDRRAGHAAHDADVPHGRRRRRRHHARSSARRRDLRGAEPEGRGEAGRGRRSRRARGERAGRQAHDRSRRARRERRAAGRGRPTSSRGAPASWSPRVRSSSRATPSTRARARRPTCSD